MEVKLSQGGDRLSLPKLLPNPIFPSHTASILYRKSSMHKYFRGLARKWRFRLQDMLKYGISIYAIAAANKNILDIDIVFEGQHITVPSASVDIQAAFKLQQNHLGSLHLLDRLLELKSFNVLSSHPFPHGKTTGYFLVLVPLIAFCIRCIITAFHTRAAGELRSQGESEPEGRHPGRRNKRWKSALSDIGETDDMAADSVPHSHIHLYDQSQDSLKEVSHAYSKLELDYQKFLSECGMSEWGHWRGGYPE